MRRLVVGSYRVARLEQAAQLLSHWKDHRIQTGCRPFSTNKNANQNGWRDAKKHKVFGVF